MITTLEAEWHERNEKGFSDYGRTSHFKAWWRCSTCQHEWQSTKSNRTSRGSGCPECRKRQARGSNNPKWTGYGEISGRQWLYMKREASQFEITIEYAWELFMIQERKCVFTGVELTMWGKKNGQQTGTASLDRIDSSQGYVEGNVQWVDKRIQHVKRNWSDEDFIALCKEVTLYQTKKILNGKNIPSFEEWKSITS